MAFCLGCYFLEGGLGVQVVTETFYVSLTVSLQLAILLQKELPRPLQSA